MSEPKNRLPGHLTKEEVSTRYGFDEKTLDRRRKEEPLLACGVKAGRNIWFPIEAVNAYFEYGIKRGRL